MTYSKKFDTIWANYDPNFHLRHTAYNDYAAQMRVSFFNDHGFTPLRYKELMIGPILFREETIYLKEIGLDQTSIEVDIALAAARKDGSRWKIIHNVYRHDGEKSAVITVEGAWLDLKIRKLTSPPPELLKTVEMIPKTADFQEIPDKKA